MATVDKDFRVKHGLVVEGTNATVNGSNVLTEASTNFLNDTIGSLLESSSQTNIAITYDELTNALAITAENGVADSDTDDLTEGNNNLYFTDERAQDAVGNAVDGGLTYTDSTGAIAVNVGTGIEINGSDQVAINRTTVDAWYDEAGAASTVAGDLSTHISDTSTHGVTGNIVGTSDAQSLSNKTLLGPVYLQSGGGAGGTNNTLDVSNSTGELTISSGYGLNLSSSNDVAITSTGGDIILNPDGGAYVGSVSAGNEIATNGYVDNAVSGLDWKQAVHLLAVSNVDLGIGAAAFPIDGHSTPSEDYRILLTNQSTDSENGIWVYSTVLETWSRPTDADAYSELVGAAVFVMEGTQYNNTSWVQSNHYLSAFTGQSWTQFSGSGSVTAGTGITVDGLEVSIDRTTVDTWYEPAGAVEDHSDLITGVHGVTGNVVGTTDAQTLTNKTLTSPEIATITNGVATLTLPSSTGTIALTSDIPTLDTDDVSEGTTNLYFTQERAEDAAAGIITSASHNGISVTYTDNGAAAGTLAFTNDGVTSISGTTNQVSVTGSTGSVTIGLPQDIATTSTPTFGGVTAGSVTLTDALIGTATQAITDGSATIVDSWSTSAYSSAKYLVQMKKGNDIEIIEVLVTVDGNNNVYVTEYADIQSNIQLGTTDADYLSGNVRLLVTSTNGTTIKVHKTLIEA